MTTQYAMLAKACGLSHRDAADFLGVRVNTAKSWAWGRRKTPPGILDTLARLECSIESAARELAENAETDFEVEALRWPCDGVNEVVIGRALARRRVK